MRSTDLARFAIVWIAALGAFADPAPQVTVMPTDSLLRGCEVHGIAADEFEHVVPCGAHSQLQSVRTVWLERDGWITPFGSDYPSETLTLPLVRAAHITVKVPSEVRVSLIHLATPKRGKRFIRTVAPSTSVQVPPGRLLAIAYDATGDAALVSRPFDVAAGASINIELRAPANGADVVALLSGTSIAHTAPTLTSESATSPADVIIPAETQLTAIWYAVEHRHASIAASNAVSYLAPLEIRPRSRGVTTVRAELRPLPSLHVSIEADGKLATNAIRNSVIRLIDEGNASAIVERNLRDEHDIRFTALKPASYVVELELTEWTATTRADLSSGDDSRVTIEVAPISITGRVTQNGKPVHARIALRYGRNMPKTETDERGDYALRVWRQGRYQLEVAPMQPPATEPHLDMLVITADKVVDIDLPANRLTLRVIDEANRKPIGAAQVSVRSAWKGSRVTIRPVTTNAAGVVQLPPFYPGEVTLQASAEGFLDGQPLRVPILDRMEPKEIEIALQRDAASTPLSVMLPNGTPAAGAEVIAIRDLLEMSPVLWRDRADGSGVIRVPQSMSGAFLAVRHEHAAGLIRPWQPDGGSSWSLSSPATQRVIVQARGHDDRNLAGFDVIGWIDNVRVGGELLAFLTWSMPVTNGHGIWIGRNLPAAPLRVLIAPRASLSGSGLDALATTIPYPWSGTQFVQGIE
ncbi:MAG TPA: carboxypeptidase-like regulatory domain-containing protein [Thermoanaerobaculia bacterium]|jgi:hypothetical protein|nr:carboxypeptidase-like regulatory domain-containing protein [Thermoanaerobaculia bacterium]